MIFYSLFVELILFPFVSLIFTFYFNSFVPFFIFSFSPGPNGGSAYLFTTEQGAWTQQAQLFGTNATATSEQQFGTAVMILNNTVLVGAPGQNNGVGGVYIFEGKQVTFAPSTPPTPAPTIAYNEEWVMTYNVHGTSPNSYFGNALTMAGGIAVVGANGASESM